MKKLVSFLLLAILSLTIISTPITLASADTSTVETITLNNKYFISLSGSETKSYQITIPDNKFYAVETLPFVNYIADTYLSVSNLTPGTFNNNDDSGIGNCSLLTFSNQGGRTITITVGIRENSPSGNFYLQVRKQQAVYYGFDYSTLVARNDDIYSNLNTLADLTIPYNSFANLYDSYKFENKLSSHFIQNDDRNFNRYNSEIMFFAGHGMKDVATGQYGHKMAFAKTNDEYNNEPKFSTVNINNIGDMSNVKLAVWASCYSANTNNEYSTSFVDKSVAVGAETALGYVNSVDSTSAKRFTDHLFERMSLGWPVGSAARYAANRLVLPQDDAQYYTIAGSTSTSLDSPVYIKTNTQTQVSYEHKYYDLINNHEYVSYENDFRTRYYMTINGVLTNQFVDIAKKNVSDAFVAENYNVKGKITILPTLYEYNILSTSTEEKHLIYIVENNVATPVLITYTTITYDDGATYVKTTCRNLNNGEYFDYSTINSI